MFKKNKVLAFLLLGITFGFSNLTSLVTNTKKLSNIGQKNTFFAKNDFDIHLSESAWWPFASYSQTTNWNLLASDRDLVNCIKKYDRFSLQLNLSMWYYYGSPDYKYEYFIKFVSIDFSTNIILKNRTTEIVYYGKTTDAAGSVTEDFQIFFTLIDNNIHFKLCGFIRSGWCWSIDENGVDASLKKGSSITFF